MRLPNASFESSAVPSTSSLQDTSTPNDKGQACHCDVCKRIGKEPPLIPGKIWVPVWSLQDPPTIEVTNKSFEEIVLDKIKGPVEKPVKTRRKVHMKTKILTDEEYLAELKFQEDEANKKKEKKESRKRPAIRKEINFSKKKTKTWKDNIDDFEVEEETGEEIEEESEVDAVEISAVGDEEQLLSLWRKLSPPVEEKHVVQKCVVWCY